MPIPKSADAWMVQNYKIFLVKSNIYRVVIKVQK